MFLKKNNLLIFIFFLALVLRFYKLDELTTFGGDQGYDFIQVLSILKGDLTLLGPKIGPYNDIGHLFLGPAYYYLLAPSLFVFNYDPIGPAYFTSLLSALTVIFIYFCSNELFNKKTAFTSSFIYAISPFVVMQSKTSSNPHLVPFFSSIVLLLLLKTLKNKRPLYFFPFLTGFLLSIMFQLHYLSFVLLFTTTLLLIRPKKYGEVFLTFLGFLSGSLPQILFELRNDFFVLKLLLKQLSTSDAIFTRVETASKLSDIFKTFNQIASLNIFLPIFVICFIYFATSKLKSEFKLVIILPIILLVFAVLLYSGPPGAHYFSSVYPMFFIATSAGLTILISKGLSFRILAFAFVFGLIAISFKNTSWRASESGINMPEGWNLKGQKKAAKMIKADKFYGDFNIASVLDGDTRNMPIRFLLDSSDARILDVENYPNAPAIYLLSRDDEINLSNYTVWEVSSYKPFVTKNLGEVQNGIFLYKLTK